MRLFNSILSGAAEITVRSFGPFLPGTLLRHAFSDLNELGVTGVFNLSIALLSREPRVIGDFTDGTFLHGADQRISGIPAVAVRTGVENEFPLEFIVDETRPWVGMAVEGTSCRGTLGVFISLPRFERLKRRRMRV